MFHLNPLTWTALFCLLCFPGWLKAQDAYHISLQDDLQTNYGLPLGNWVLNDTEVANLQTDFTYGEVVATELDASGQDFSKKVQLDVTQVVGPQWNTGYGLGNLNSINQGDHCLLVFWVRADGGGKISLAIQDNTTFSSEKYFNIPLTDSWNQYLIPFEASQDYQTNDLGLAFQLNWMDQQIEIGGLALLNYGTAVSLDDLPQQLNNEFYEGYEMDAPWRAEAAQRIDQLRKADLSIQVLNADQGPMENVSVQFRMLDHEFGFGTAVAVQNLAGNSLQNDDYEDRLLDLDGEGHRFNCAVFENATKWNAWENNWFGVSKEDKANTMQWLLDRGFKVRGHTLIWPSWTNLPDDLFDNQGDPAYIIDRVIDHVESILTYPGLEGNFSDWDVLNEISILQDLANAVQGAPGYPTGREIYLDILEKFYEIEPNGIAYINDYTTFGAGSSPQLYADLKIYLQEIIDAGFDIDGVGFQGHIGAYPTSILELYDILEDFYTTFGTQAKITEFDMNVDMGDELAAQYLRDFYTMSFSHPSMDAILMWGYWDGNHWRGNAPMFEEDWSLKPAGQAFLDLVFDEWWTEESGTTDVNGLFSTRAFKGTYEIVVGCPDGTYTQTIDVLSDTSLPIDCSTVSTTELKEKSGLQVAPNPTNSTVEVRWGGNQAADLLILDQLGRTLQVESSVFSPAQITLDLPSGTYHLLLRSEGSVLVEKIVVE